MRLSAIRFLRGIQILLPAATSQVMNWRERAENVQVSKNYSLISVEV